MSSKRGGQRSRSGRGSWSAARRGASAAQLAALASQLEDCITAMESVRYGSAARDLTTDELNQLEGYYAEMDEVTAYLGW